MQKSGPIHLNLNFPGKISIEFHCCQSFLSMRKENYLREWQGKAANASLNVSCQGELVLETEAVNYSLFSP